MRKTIFWLLSLFIISSVCNANLPSNTHRRLAISNQHVRIWQTTIFPGRNQALKMHRHENNRVIVALNNGRLKINSSRGKEKFLNLAKNKAYFLIKDPLGELHTDENITRVPLKVLVIELKNERN